MDSILTSVKKHVGGIYEECEDFDVDIIDHINGVFVILWRMGVGPAKCFRIEDKNNTWDEFTQDIDYLEAVKTYIGQKVKLIFDPPNNSSLLQALKDSIAEFEWTLNFAAETKTEAKEET